MQFLLNTRLRPGVTRAQFIEHFKNERDNEGWDLVRKGVIQHWLWKVGDEPGLLVIVNCESEEEAKELANTAPAVEAGIVTFDLDPVDPFPTKLW